MDMKYFVRSMKWGGDWYTERLSILNKMLIWCAYFVRSEKNINENGRYRYEFVIYEIFC